MDGRRLAVQARDRPARRPCRRPDSNRRRGRRGSHARCNRGCSRKPGMPADRAGPITESSDASTVTSPPIQIASAPRPMTERDRFANSRRVVDVRLEQLDPQLPADGPGDLRARLGIRLRRVPGDADTRQLRRELPGHAERLGHRLHRADPDHVGRMLHRDRHERSPHRRRPGRSPCRRHAGPSRRGSPRPPPEGWRSRA